MIYLWKEICYAKDLKGAYQPSEGRNCFWIVVAFLWVFLTMGENLIRKSAIWKRSLPEVFGGEFLSFSSIFLFIIRTTCCESLKNIFVSISSGGDMDDLVCHSYLRVKF